jgi:hypothetical protein
MKHYEERTTTRTDRVEVSRTCDLCGRVATRSGWDAGIYDTEIAVTVKQREGTSYPEGGSGTEYEIDLCPDCFKGRLVPWLKEQGARIEPKEWDW